MFSDSLSEPRNLVTHDTWEQPCFGYTEEDSSDQKTFKTLNETHSNHDDTPSDHDDGQPHRWSFTISLLTETTVGVYGVCVCGGMLLTSRLS